ncbi:hypothetical protein QJS04_geneDACA023535 [Acorus gramineus]|uniref:Uncharacterized protein n=1 Tax=Acorus gramineus TaxID=55184 RepID=A0AAV9BBL9_ACOGR|nr:hypothetical protein QJS04_geneDACA023535 [Acorus gramineus]
MAASMDESERMAALKRAYAEIILNTAKESAARVMASERKAQRFQQDLSASKEESLRLLVRLKSVMDSEITEAEKSSQLQATRIQELEVQLSESQKTVQQLQEELERTNHELQMLKNNTVEKLNESSLENDSTINEGRHQENMISSNESNVFPLVLKNADVQLNQTSEDRDCRTATKNPTEQTAPLDDRSSEENCADGSDLTSIIMRRKEPELYKNGCTQRIRAFEQKTKNVTQERSHVQSSNIKNEFAVMSQNCDDGQAGKLHGRSLRTRRARSKYMTVTQENAVQTLSSSVHCKTSYECLDVSGEALSRKSREAHKKEFSIGVSEEHAGNSMSVSNDEKLKNKTVSSSAEKDLLTSKDHCEEMENVGCSGDQVPLSTTEIKTDSVCLDGTDSHAQICQGQCIQGVTDGDFKIPCNGIEHISTENLNSTEQTHESGSSQVVTDGPLKYTFQRKRKRGSSSNNIENITPEENISRKSGGDKKTALPPPQPPIIESARSNRRLVQVARQLISLSEKRWR